MINEPKVTVVTVTYQLIASGREEYFCECVESVHNQTHKNIEHIVIDGASNDGTVALIDEYAQKGWLTYISEPDSGIYDAMNKGIARASGKYIAFLNSDDFYHNPRAVELSVQSLEKTGAGFSIAPWIIQNQEQTKLYRSPNLYHCLTGSVMWCHQTLFCRLELLSRYGLFDTSFRIAADYHWLLKVLADGTAFTELSEPIVTFRLGGTSSLRESDTNREVMFAIYDVIRSRTQVSWGDVYQIYAFRCLPWRILRVLVATYPRQTRHQFYHANLRLYMSHMWHRVKTFRKNMLNIRLTHGKRDVRLLGWTLINDRPTPVNPEPPAWVKDVVR